MKKMISYDHTDKERQNPPQINQIKERTGMIMTHMYVKFNQTEQIVDFVKLMNRCTCEADIKCGRIVVDAKSLLGVMAVAINRTVELILHTEEENSRQITSLLSSYAA